MQEGAGGEVGVAFGLSYWQDEVSRGNIEEC